MTSAAENSKYGSAIRYFLLATICVLFIPLYSYGDKKNGAQYDVNNAPSQKKHLKTIIVDDYYPYTFVNQNGKPDGFSVDLIKAVTQEMGLELEIDVDTWELARNALEKGDIDVLPMMAYSKERGQVFDFSVPHTIAYDAFFTRKGLSKIRSLDDLRGKQIIVMKDDQAHDYLLSTGFIAPEQLILVDSLPDALRLLSSGKGDAALMPKLVGLIVAKNLKLSNIELSPVVIETYKRPFSFAVVEGNQSLLERLSQGLSIIKASGQYNNIYKKWFGALKSPGLSLRKVLKYIGGIILVFIVIGSVLLLWSFSLRKQVALRTRALEEEIAERKRAEEALRESEEKFKLHFDNASDVIYSVDSNFRVLEVSPSVERTLGYKPDELIGRPFQDLNILAKNSLQPVVTDGIKVLSGETISSAIYEFVAKDGSRILGEVSGAPFLKKGKIVGIVSIARDITGRKRAEEALRESEEKYKRFVENAVVGVYQVTREGSFRFVNEKMAEMFGYDKPERLLKEGPNIADLYARPEERPVVLREMDENDFIRGREVEFRKRDGSGVWVALSARRVMEEGKTFYEGLMEDITERKQMETQLQQSQKMEAVGTLAGGIAHDFNNILAIILGNAELASDDIPDWNPASNSLKEIHRASIRAKDMVHQLLAFSRKSDEKSKPIDMAPIIKESMKMLRSAVPTSVEFKQHISDDACNVLGDATQINQIVMNLVINAADAMSKEGGLLEVTLENILLQEEKACFDWVLSPGPYVRLRMRDTGEGIEPEIMKRIFDPYYTTKEVGKGTGMGLSVIHGIVKRHGGGILVESELGKGTLFEIYFPALEETAEEEKEPDGEIKGGSERILFVDDEESMVNLNRQRLERLGYRVKSTTKPVEVLEWFKADPDQFDVIITDMAMPRMTGDRLAAEVLKIRPHMPVIICTGYSERMSAKKAESIGVRKYIEKPIDLRNLASALREVLEER